MIQDDSRGRNSESQLQDQASRLWYASEPWITGRSTRIFFVASGKGIRSPCCKTCNPGHKRSRRVSQFRDLKASTLNPLKSKWNPPTPPTSREGQRSWLYDLEFGVCASVDASRNRGNGGTEGSTHRRGSRLQVRKPTSLTNTPKALATPQSINSQPLHPRPPTPKYHL